MKVLEIYILFHSFLKIYLLEKEKLYNEKYLKPANIFIYRLLSFKDLAVQSDQTCHSVSEVDKCEAQARVGQGLARDGKGGPLRQKPLKLKTLA